MPCSDARPFREENWGIIIASETVVNNFCVELSCKSQYALLALIELATHYHDPEPRQVRQISAQHNIPDRYLEQLLATLRRCGIVRSQRGSKGGYYLAKEPGKITLFDVVNCLEGTDPEATSQNSCLNTIESAIIWEFWQEAEQMANSVLQKYTLKDLCEQRDARQQKDIMYYI